MEELKPCPFCGGDEIFSHIQVGGLGVRGLVECMNPACGVVVMSPWSGSIATAKKRAAKIWNRRAGECDRDALLSVCSEVEDADVDGCIDWADRIREAIGEVSEDAPVA